MRKSQAFSLFVFLQILIFSSSIVSAYELGLTWSVGWNSASFSLINRSLSSWAERHRLEAYSQGWQTESTSIASLHAGYTSEVGLQLAFHSKFSLQVCTGILYFELDEKDTSLNINKGGDLFIYAHPVKATALPIGAELIYFFKISNKFRHFLKGGGGLILARYIEREANRSAANLKFVYPVYQNATATSPYFLAGWGLAFNPERATTYFLEANYRWAKVTNFKGVNKAGEKGPLEFYEDYCPSLDFWQARLVIVTAEPNPEFTRQRQKSVIDFSGFSVKIGVTIKF